MAGRTRVPKVRLVHGESAGKFKSMAESAASHARPVARSTAAFVRGMMPVIAIMALAMGLVWTLAMQASP